MHLISSLSRNFCGAALALGLVACQQSQPQLPSRPTRLPQDERVQAYTNHEPASQYTEPYRKQTRSGDDLEQLIVDEIASAQTSVEVAVQEFRLPKIAKALSDRAQAGVKVRVILENSYSRPVSSIRSDEIAKLPERERDRYSESLKLIDQNGDGQLSPTEINQGDALVMLDNAKIPRLDDTAGGSRGSNLMHHKFVIVDGRTIVVTSTNFTPSDVHGDFKTLTSRGNANNLLKIDSSELAALFIKEFNLMWGDGPGGKPDSLFGVKKPHRAPQQVQVGNTTIEVQFSPSASSLPWGQTTNGLIGKTLSQSSQSIEMALFVFSDQSLANLLDIQHQKGAQIKVLIDPSFMFRPYSEGLDLLGVSLGDTCKLDPDNRPWQTPITTIGVPRLPPGDLLHHKFGIVDTQTVITGSHNWTVAANQGNDETLLVIHSSLVAAHFQREFDRLYTDAILGLPPAIRRKVEAYQQQCRKPTPMPSIAPVSKWSMSAKPQKSAPQQSAETTNQQVNLNTATQVELEALPGIGPGLAKRIIAARAQKPFASLADLDRVSGVGPKLIEKLRDQVTW